MSCRFVAAVDRLFLFLRPVVCVFALFALFAARRGEWTFFAFGAAALYCALSWHRGINALVRR